jgi:hypothetical protein
MTIELLMLRQASQELDYRNRVCADAIKFPTAQKSESAVKHARDLKRAGEAFKKALATCNEHGVQYSPTDLPKSFAVHAMSA